MEIHQSETIRVPLPICYGQDHHSVWLVLEHLDIHHGMQGNAADLGTRLAAMHRVVSKQFGWIRNNTIGQTLQINAMSSDWIHFWRTQRLGYQLDLAKANVYHGKIAELGEQLLLNLDQFFSNNSPFLHCCTEICGVAITLMTQREIRFYTIRLFIMAIARLILP